MNSMKLSSLAFRILFVFSVICLSWTGLDAALAETGKTYVVAFAQDTMENDWRIAQVKELEGELAKYPFIKFIYTDARGQTAKQIEDIEDLISMGIDVLVTSPRDAKAMTPVIAKAYKKGIPVVLLSREIESPDYTIFIHPDNRRIARQAAEYMVQELKGKGKIFILQHIPTTTPAIHRTEPFFETIQQHKGMQIVAMKVASSLRAEAIKKTEEALLEGIEFNAIYAQSDSMASGARIALKKAGIDPRTILIVGIDYISEAREAIRSGEQAASFTYPTGGKEGAQYIIKVLRGEKVPKEVIIDSIMVTRENVEAVKPIF